jgi:Raf kinase inhibitor-like YbhB/YbcL family protein
MIRRLLCVTATLAVAVAAGAHIAAQAPGKLTVTSSAFKGGETIPVKYTGSQGAANVSPPIAWSGAPAAAKQYALILDDPDAAQFGGGMPFVHWVIYKIPAAATSLPEAIPAGPVASGAIAGAIQGLSGFFNGRGRGGAAPPPPVYRGPAPPAGSGPHHYHFTVYALDIALDLQEGLSKPALLQAMQGHIVAQGEIVGIFENK